MIVLMLSLVLGAGSLLAGVAWPRAGRIAAACILFALAAGSLPSSVPALIQAAEPDPPGAIGNLAGLAAIVTIGAGGCMAGLGVAVLRGEDTLRWLVTVVLGAIAAASVRWTGIEVTRASDDVRTGLMIAVALIALGTLASAGLLVGASGVLRRR